MSQKEKEVTNMKFYANQNFIVVTKKETEWNQNGAKGVTYKLGIEQNDEMGEFRCTEAVFHKVEKYREYNACGDVLISMGTSDRGAYTTVTICDVTNELDTPFSKPEEKAPDKQQSTDKPTAAESKK